MKKNYTTSALIRHLKKDSPILLTVISSIGVVTTVAMAIKATPKAIELIRSAEEEKQEELSRIEVIETTIKCYIPTIVVGLSTLACLISSCVVGQKQQATYIAAYTMIDNAFKEYRSKTVELYGEDSDDSIRAELASKKCEASSFTEDSEKCVFYEEFRGEFFELSKEELLLAELELNRTFALRGAVDLNTFYRYLGLPEKDIGNVLGWSQVAGWEFYGYAWIDFEHKKHMLDDGMEYYIIQMPFPPTADWEDY